MRTVAANEKVSVIEILLKNVADVNEKDYDFFTVFLFAAKSNSHSEVLHLLAEFRGNTKATTGDGIGDNANSVEVRYEDENIWCTQKMMATLYGVDVRTINDHIQKIFHDNELNEVATIQNFRIVQNEGNREVARDVKHYNLQMIIAVGFKVNNEKAV